MSVGITKEKIQNPQVSHLSLLRYYSVDPYITSSVNTFVDQVLGAGFYISCGHEDAEKFITENLRRMKFKSKLKTFLLHTCIYGNGAFEKIGGTTLSGGRKTIYDLKVMDMATVTALERRSDYDTTPKNWIQTIHGSELKIPYKKTIHMRYETPGDPNDLGISMFFSLAVRQYRKKEGSFSILDDMASMRTAFAEILRKMSSPDRVFVMQNESEEVIRDFATKYEQRAPGEALWLNKDIEFKELSIDGKTRFEKMIDYIDKVYESGTQSPTAKLMTSNGVYSKDSAEATISVMENRIIGMQDSLGRLIEDEIIKPMLEDEGFDIEEVKPELHFGQENLTNFQMSDIKGLADGNIISKLEAREALGQLGFNLTDKEFERKIHEEQMNPPEIQQQEETSNIPEEQSEKGNGNQT